MSFPISRTMRLSDYQQLVRESEYVDVVQTMAGPRHPHQHQHRQWEYAMVLRVYSSWVHKVGKKRHLVGDFGCGVGLSPSIMLAMGADVTCYEPWVHGNEEKFQLDALESVVRHSRGLTGKYKMEHRPLCELDPKLDHGKYDVSLCISTLEHIGEYQRAWIDLLDTVKPGGLVFITSDFAEDEEDHYLLNYLRAGRMFTKETYKKLLAIGHKKGFELLGEAPDWYWGSDAVLVNDYGFASLAMVRNEN